MYLTSPQPRLIGAFIVGAILVALVLVWYLRKLPRETARINVAGGSGEIRSSLLGSLSLLAVGTFGANQLRRLLVLLDQCGLSELVGSIGIFECDAGIRMKVFEAIPAVYRDRVVFGFTEGLSGGVANRSPEWVEDRIDYWGPPLLNAARDLIDLHKRRNGNRHPSLVLSFLSMGGHFPLGVPVLEVIHEAFEQSMMLGFTALPVHTALRGRYAELKEEYEERGIHGWVINDNLGEDPITADYGMIGIIEALADAALYADASTQPNNTFALALGQTPGQVLVYEVVSDPLVAFPFRPLPFLPPKAYYLHTQPTIEAVITALRKLAAGRGIWSVDLPVGAMESSTFDIVMLPLHHPDITTIRDTANAGRQGRAAARKANGNGAKPEAMDYFGKENYEAPFSSYAVRIDKARPVGPLVAIRLTAVRDGSAIVDQIVKVPAARALTGAKATIPNGRKIPALNGSAGGEQKNIKEVV